MLNLGAVLVLSRARYQGNRSPEGVRGPGSPLALMVFEKTTFEKSTKSSRSTQVCAELDISQTLFTPRAALPLASAEGKPCVKMRLAHMTQHKGPNTVFDLNALRSPGCQTSPKSANRCVREAPQRLPEFTAAAR